MRNTVVLVLGLGLLPGPAAAEPGPTPKGPVSHPFLCADYGQSKVFLVSAAGKITWQYAAPQCQDAWRLAGGNVLLSHLRGVVEVTPEGKVAWEYRGGPNVEIHTCQPLPGGLVLVAECGTCRVLEIDRQGKIVRQFPFQTTTQNVHAQIRHCRKTPAGTYLVAFTGEGIVREFDGRGKIVRTIPTPGCPYLALRLPNGNTLIACGDLHKLIEVDRHDKVVWQLDENDVPGNPLRFVAGVERLPNGNTVVSNWGGHGHVGQQPQIFEVTRDKKVVWQVFDDQQFGTISNVQVLDVEGDPAKGGLLR